MTIKTTKIIENNIFTVSIEIYNISVADMKLFEYFGEPEIDLGGTMLTYEYPHKYKKLFSDSPHQFLKDITDPDSEVKAECDNWADTMLTRITTIMTDIRANDITWIDETITTI